MDQTISGNALNFTLGAHRPEGVTVNKKRAPAFSMGKRHSQFTRILMV